jgi:hypothetical protein
VYKLGRSFEPGDIVVYREPAGTAMIGRIVWVGAEQLTIASSDKPHQSVSLRQVVGRVVLNTR